MTLLRKIMEGRNSGNPDLDESRTGDEGYPPPSQDTIAAISELSRVVRNNPDAVEIYLALGNLFRSQGEIERAVQIRNQLIVREGLKSEFKGRALFELGRDFKRGGFHDRALDAFEQARKILGKDPAILRELAKLSSQSGDFEAAARYYEQVAHPLAQAHYLVRRWGVLRREGHERDARKAVKKALDVYPESVEAWLALLVHDYDEESAAKLSDRLREALDTVEEPLRFALLEGLMQYVSEGVNPLTGSPDEEADGRKTRPPLSDSVLPVLEELEPDVLLTHYGGLISLASGDTGQARVWLEKALVLDPDFWPARLELLSLNVEEQDLSQSFKEQLRFFTSAGRNVKRFVCTICGLRRPALFFVCPRCQSWHSIRFRMNLTE